MEFYWTDVEVEVGYDEDGPVYGSLYTPIVQFESGKRCAYTTSFRDLEEVDAFVGACNASRDEGVDVLLAQAGDWVEVDPCYGSEYHQSIGDAHLMSDEELRHNNNRFAC